MIEKIKGVIKEYEWGSCDFLPSLFGYDVSNVPQAEAWFGTHPAGCAVTESSASLKDTIQSDPERLLGDRCYHKFGPDLPLLLKILAIRTPLSIQCHPTREIAAKGFEDEKEARENGTPLSELNYKDSNQKAEVLYALTPVTAMCGFREESVIRKDLERVIPVTYAAYFKADKSIGELFRHLYTIDSESLNRIVNELVSNMELERESSDPRFLSSREIVLRAYKLYGDDPGLLCAYLLNVVWLEPGQALYLKPKTLHAYVFGNGVELMSLSDNVLRGGLTHKKVDVPELMRVMDTESFHAEKCHIEKDEFGRRRVFTPTDDFTLFEIGKGSYTIKEPTPSLLLSTSGRTSVSSPDASLVLEQGECCFISADEECYTIKVEGEAFQAAVPLS